MTTARASQVDPATTPYYHLVSRCVRRAFLCGRDPLTKQDFEHRKAWLVGRLRLLGSIFALDICAYAVMSNHYHLVVRLAPERAEAWSDDEVIERYEKLFCNARRQIEFLEGDPERRAARIEVYRQRLASLSWMMRVLNEYIARRANKEDRVTGRFWEGRFKSQALLDEAAVLTCMAYVDLNPVRAGAARTLEESKHTSIYERLMATGADLDAVGADGSDGGAVPAREASAEAILAEGLEAATAGEVSSPPPPLMPFADEPPAAGRSPSDRLFTSLPNYVELLEWTGRAVRKGKAALRGAPPDLLVRRGVDPEAWLRLMRASGLAPFGCFGTEASLRREAARTSRRWLKGQAAARRLFAA